MISPHSAISHWIKKDDMKKKITKEFGFFDSTYFKTVKKDSFDEKRIASITIYFSGHGDEGAIINGDDDGKRFMYKDMIQFIKDAAENQTEKLSKDINFKIYWDVDLQLDCCHSGGAI